MKIGKFQYIILSMLDDMGCDNKLKTMSCYDIQEKIESLGYTSNYIKITLVRFENENYVSRGFNDRRSHTYYITEKGKQFLKELKGE